VPNWVIRLAATFDPLVRDRLFELDKHRPCSSAKAVDVLGWAPRSNEAMIVDTARSLISRNLL
jgi:dihydroflavonol-4-reductase